MENASKALIIAGGVMIAILLLTLFSFVISRIGEYTATIYDNLESSEIDEFNQKFLNYDGITISFQDVVTIVNLAIENNHTQKLPTTIVVNVKPRESDSNPKSWTDDYANKTSYEIFTENIDLINNKYDCKVEISTETKLVNEVIITPHPSPP